VRGGSADRRKGGARAVTSFDMCYPGNRVDPTAIISPGVQLGTGNVVGPYAVITGRTVIGDGNWIAPHACIGTPAEWRGKPLPVAWDGELGDGRVVIGDRNVIREFVTVNAGTEQATRVGDDCYLMARSHLGHDVIIEDGVTLATGAQLGGFSNVWSWAFLGLGCQVHQWGQIGPGAMVGMGAAAVHPVLPFRTVVGMPAKAIGGMPFIHWRNEQLPQGSTASRLKSFPTSRRAIGSWLPTLLAPAPTTPTEQSLPDSSAWSRPGITCSIGTNSTPGPASGPRSPANARLRWCKPAGWCSSPGRCSQPLRSAVMP